MLSQLWDLLIAFGRASNLGFGGGPAVIPLIKIEVVERYHWMTNSEFTDALAVGNALPGPIATKLAGYVGYQEAGWLGALVANIGVILPTALAVILLARVLMKYSNSPVLKGMLKGVRPVVVVLIAQTALDMGIGSFPNLITWGIALATVVSVFWLKLHPALIILVSMGFGLLVFR
ncbi:MULTISPECIES: chromate transporter [Desulfosporosinus]|uniref:Chromate transporter n=1 Tax=Desulfosporosinus lacus DSM 15449 TaxID=1121420 RepID=A0A1M5YDB1_9FIRM|nr:MULTISPECIES: chromate transporter [Desulfosporosinus]MCO1600826.1 chromate transporter [Desulfosporosinus nitroreducens]MCO5384657.1 chromate transporter [Desulfosporosinus sp.]MDA8221318.1 chromate transporter [Desulfitobacterium hafniense]SHI09956.1 chromate transporter [Desulfosporosinus lacus DSM 15449]